MTERDFDRFAIALNELACNYLAKIEGDELGAYFRALSRFPIDLVEQQLPEALEQHPTYFPKSGELILLCQSVLANYQRPSVEDSAKAIQQAAKCPHEWRYEPETDSTLWAGFDVCARCGLSKPRLRADAPREQKEYLRMAIAGAQAPTETDTVQ